MKLCLVCSKPLHKKQTMYCSERCGKYAWYVKNKAAILERKAKRLKAKKGKPVEVVYKYELPPDKVRFKDYLKSIGKAHLWKSAT